MGFFTYRFVQFVADPTSRHKMKQILILFCHISLISCGIVKNATSWMQAVEQGKIPELTPEQHVLLFGGMLENMPDPSRWAEDADKGRLPVTTLSDDHKILLFGDKVAMRFSPNLTTNYPRSLNEFMEHWTLELPSPITDQITSLNLAEILPKEADVEGRGRLKKILIPVLLAMTLIAAIVLPALMTVIKLIAVKGLWSGVVSLIISKLLGLKALLNHHHHHSDEGKRPYFVYVPHGKHRREEEENLQDQRQPYDQWGGDNWEHWSRKGASGDI